MKSEPSFDETIMELLDDPAFIQEDINSVSPFRTIIRILSVGLTLTFFTIQFGNVLDIVLPLIGTLCICFGMVRLHKENRQFHYAYVTSLILLCLFILLSILQATPISIAVISVLSLLIPLMKLLLLSLYTMGLKASFQRTIPEMNNTMILYGIVMLLLLISATIEAKDFLSILCGLLYLIMLYFFHRTRKKMEDDGYQLQLTYPKHAKRMLLSIILVILCYSVTLSYTLYYFSLSDKNQYEVQTTLQYQEERASLIEKGLQEELVKDLRDEDVIALNKLEKFAYAKDTFGPNEIVTLGIYFGYSTNGDLHVVSSYQVKDSFAKRQVVGSFLPSSTSTEYQRTLVTNLLLYDKQDQTYIAFNPKEFSSLQGEHYRGYCYEKIQWITKSTICEYSLTYYDRKHWLAYPYQAWQLPEVNSDISSLLMSQVTSPLNRYSYTTRVDREFFEFLSNQTTKN